jgi:hypothetical protein
MNTKGGAHLEMILAFVLFLSAVMFIFVYLKPMETDKLSETVGISLKNFFVEQVSREIVTVYVNGSSDRCSPKNISAKNWSYENVSATTYYVYFSDEFLSKEAECTNPYSLGSLTNRTVLSDSLIKNIQLRYYSDYSSLKQELKVPEVFEFEIYSEDYKYNMTREESDELNIIAKRYPLRVLNSSGNSSIKNFVFKVW